jgi:hypothetical protein
MWEVLLYIIGLQYIVKKILLQSSLIPIVRPPFKDQYLLLYIRMDITEVAPDKKIVISKVEFVCDIIDKSIPKPLPQTYNHFLILSAPPRSGKSTWVMNCLCKQGEVINKSKLI